LYKFTLFIILINYQVWSIDLSSYQAVFLALRNNTALKVQENNPKLIITQEKSSRAQFDSKLSAGIESSKTEGLRGYGDDESFEKNKLRLSLSKKLKTGTTLELEGATSADDINEDPVSNTKFNENIQFEITQPLLKGRGKDISLIEVKKARENHTISQSQLKAYTMGLIADVLNAYWNTYYLKAKLKMVKVSKELAQAQKERVTNMIDAGDLAEIEAAASQAELASRDELVVSTQGDLDIQRIQLLALLNPEKSKLSWDTEFDKMDDPTKVSLELTEKKETIQRGLVLRPEIEQVKHKLAINDLEVMQSRNGVLPKLDMFMRINRSKYRDTFSNGKSDKLDHGKEFAFGLSFTYALGQRAEKAKLEKNIISRDQQKLSFENLKLAIEVDIRLSWIRVHKLKQKKQAASQTLKHMQKSVEAELNKFNVGHSTSLNVARAQRDLLTAELGHLKTNIDIIKALISLAEADGTLIQDYVTLSDK